MDMHGVLPVTGVLLTDVTEHSMHQIDQTLDTHR